MQSSFSDLEYAAKKKLTRRDRFLAGIHAATPWAALEAEIEPFYPQGHCTYLSFELLHTQTTSIDTKTRSHSTACASTL